LNSTTHATRTRGDFAPTLPYSGHPQALYAAFFGLNKEPFSIAPDPRFLFMSEIHREALAHLLYGLAGGGGFVLLTGEIGAGKTTVCRAFLEQIPAHCAVAYIFNPQLSAAELLQTVCDEFGIQLAPRVPGAATVKEQIDALNQFLLAAHAQGRQGVLIIDEAQSLSAPVLEQLRLLTNLETAERKLLQIVLIGQPELRTLLARPELEQLAQRVIARYHLPALAEGQTQAYMQHRWAVAGAAGALPFDASALRLIHRLTAGVPRRINLLCDRALLGAYAQGRTRVDGPTVKQAALEVALRPAAAPSWMAAGWPAMPTWRGLAGAGSVALLGATLLAVAAGLWLRFVPGPEVGSKATVAVAPVVSAAVSPPTLQRAASSAVAAASAATGAATRASAPVPTTRPPEAPVASSVSSSVASSVATSADVLAAAHANPAAAFGELSPLWGLAIAGGDPCEAAATAQVLCFRSRQGLGVVRQTGRPGVLTLHDAQDRPRYALLLGLSAEHAVLAAGASRWTLALPALTEIWRGEFATFWRAPAGTQTTLGGANSKASSAWLQQTLDQQRIGQPGQTLGARISAFQLAQGLPPDGQAGPLTLMHLNRLTGVLEPTLAGTGR
jgi:general secretion pathway protein A